MTSGDTSVLLDIRDLSVRFNTDSGVVSGEQVFVEKVSLIMRKNNKEFMDKVNQALADLTADGTLAKISDKYFKTDITCK